MDKIDKAFEAWYRGKVLTVGVGDAFRAGFYAGADLTPWQSIESAPKDGTHLVLWWPDSSQATQGYYWRDHWFSLYAVSGSPTHWIPLPDPPAQEQP